MAGKDGDPWPPGCPHPSAMIPAASLLRDEKDRYCRHEFLRGPRKLFDEDKRVSNREERVGNRLIIRMLNYKLYVSLQCIILQLLLTIVTVFVRRSRQVGLYNYCMLILVYISYMGLEGQERGHGEEPWPSGGLARGRAGSGRGTDRADPDRAHLRSTAHLTRCTRLASTGFRVAVGQATRRLNPPCVPRRRSASALLP